MRPGLRILMLEDSPTDAELIQRSLLQTGTHPQIMVVSTARDFAEGVDRFQPDVVLADNSLPQFNASEALRYLQDQKLRIPFIMVTGTMSEEFAVDIIKKGADDYILKGSLIRLPAAIEAAMRHREAEKARRIAIDQLVSSEKKYRGLVDSIQDGFLALDEDWRVLYINQVAERLLRREPGSLNGKRMTDEFPDAVGRPIFNTYLKVLQTRIPEVLEEFSPLFQRWLNVTYYPSEFGVSVIFHDVSEQRMAEEKARSSEEKYRMLVERITDAFIALDSDWRYTYLNPQACELIHKKQEEVLGRVVWDVFPDAVGSSTYRAMTEALARQQYRTNLDYYEPLDLWQENHIYPSPDGVTMFIRNISERKKLEIALEEQRLREQKRITATALAAQEKERNAIAVELHDNVNQILVGTNLLLTLMRDHPEKLPELLPSCMESIQEAIAENRKIAHELVSPNMEEGGLLVQLNRLTSSMLKPAGIYTEVEAEAFREERLSADRKLALYRILQEQCANIVKYAGATRVQFQFSQPENHCRVKVFDNGKGADPNRLSHGIGLKNMAARLHVFDGRMSIQTQPGQGFSLELLMPLEGAVE